jgi:putative hydrolase of the HAD superfamily
LQRTSPDGRQEVLCLHNTSVQPQAFRLGAAVRAAGRRSWIDLIRGREVSAERGEADRAVIPVAPLEALWLVESRLGRPAATPAIRSEAAEWVRIFRRHYRPLDPIPAGLRPRGRLRVQAVLFDLYGTLWVSAAGDLDSRDPARAPQPPALRELLARCGCRQDPPALAAELAAAVRAEHERLRAEGVDYPEVRIEAIWTQLLGLKDPVRARAFAVEYEALVNPVWPMPGLRAALGALRRQGLALGILSNAQFYSPYLFECFLGAGPSELGFAEELCLYSFELRRAKPSPQLFQTARQRLLARGIRPGRVLMVGNDAQRDLAPARDVGFRTALFAGDARSLRGAEEADAAEAVITDLSQLASLLGARC